MTSMVNIGEIKEKEYVIGDSIYKAQFECVGKNYHKIKGTEEFVRKANENEMVYTVPQFIIYQQRACFQC